MSAATGIDSPVFFFFLLGNGKVCFDCFEDSRGFLLLGDLVEEHRCVLFWVFFPLRSEQEIRFYILATWCYRCDELAFCIFWLLQIYNSSAQRGAICNLPILPPACPPLLAAWWQEGGPQPAGWPAGQPLLSHWTQSSPSHISLCVPSPILPTSEKWSLWPLSAIQKEDMRWN